MVKYLILLLTVCIKCELKYLVEVFRHGARNSNFGSNPDLGELNQVGQRQHFLLGTQLRKEYMLDQPFLSKQYKQQEITIISTDFNRTIQSA